MSKDIKSIDGNEAAAFLHFFDGFRTSHEIQKIECLDFDDLAKLIDYKELQNFLKHALNPDHPSLITTGKNSDIFFQERESCNPYYNNLPEIVQNYVDQLGKVTGRNYKLFQYYGAPDAERVIVAMASVSGAAHETVDYLTAKGEKVGYLEVHLYRPFSIKHFLEAIPETTKTIGEISPTNQAPCHRFASVGSKSVAGHTTVHIISVRLTFTHFRGHSYPHHYN
jgi:pyruvate-ferredoxin/flavodoxin oxidoreductase